ncbi:MAG: YcxB-like protein [Bacteroidota bacterium]
MAELPIRIHVNLTEADLEDFYYHNSRRSILMKMMIACALLVFASQLVKIVMVPDALSDGSWKWILAVLGLFFLMHYSNKMNAQKEYKRNKRLHEAHTYVIGFESVHIKGGPFNTHFQWDKLHDLSESRKCFYIWLNKGSAQIIPKRDMTEVEIEVIRAIKKSKFK